MSQTSRNLLLLFLCLLLAALDLIWSRSNGVMSISAIPDWFFDFRLPRILAAVVAGMALSAAGVALQTLFRNPLAGPYLTGITPGASFAIGLVLLAFPAGFANGINENVGLQQLGLTGAGMLGGIAVLLLQLFISRKNNGIFTLLLTGVLLSYLLGAGVEIMQTIAGAEQIRSFVMWGMGNFDRVQLVQIYWFGPVVAFGFALLLLQRFKLDAWLPGELYAKNAGVDTHILKISIILICGLLAGTTTAICGPIGFVGLAAPHLARLVNRSSSHSQLFIPAALWGACLCLVADIVAHNLFANITLNVNAICAIIGAPVVLWVVLRGRIGA